MSHDLHTPAALDSAAPLPMAAAARTASSRVSAQSARSCLAVGAVRPAPLVLGLVLVLLLGIPWVLAVAHRITDSP